MNQTRVEALYSYRPQNIHELPFKTGDTFKILCKIDDGWLVAQKEADGRKGLIFKNYVDEIQHHEPGIFYAELESNSIVTMDMLILIQFCRKKT